MLYEGTDVLARSSNSQGGRALMADPLFVEVKNLDNLRNRYELIIVAAKRSRQLRDGSKPLIETRSQKEPTIALREVLDGKVITLNVPRQKQNEQKTE
jgi:DNA-directed RNA polymerase subunit omega